MRLTAFQMQTICKSAEKNMPQLSSTAFAICLNDRNPCSIDAELAILITTQQKFL